MLQTPTPTALPQTAADPAMQVVAGNLLAPVVEQPPPPPVWAPPGSRRPIVPPPSTFTFCSEKSAKLVLAVVLMLLVNAVFIAAMFLYRSLRPLLTISFVFFLAFYTTLYFRRWLRTSSHHYHYQYDHQRSAGLRRGLGYTAFFLGDILSAIFVYASARFVPLQQAIAAWIFVAVPIGYCVYYVMVLHLELDEAAGAHHQVQQPHAYVMPPPV